LIRNLKFDLFLLISILVLIGLGGVVIYSSSGPYAEMRNLSVNYYAVSHLTKVLMGLVALLFGMILKPSWIQNGIRPAFWISFSLLLAMKFGGLGITINGARRWMRIAGFEFQPSELMKFVIILMLAHKLSELREEIRDFKKGFLPPIILVGMVFLVILVQPNYSMAMMILLVSLAMIYSAGAKTKHLVFMGIGLFPAVIYLAVKQSYRLKRIMAIFDPQSNAGSSYQQLQSLVSLGNGGLFGTGLGEGTQKLGYLPMPFTDMVYAMIGEELGFIGTSVVMLCFGILIWRGFSASLKSTSVFSSLAALGLTLSITLNFYSMLVFVLEYYLQRVNPYH
jgi:cell division protein FtsW